MYKLTTKAGLLKRVRRKPELAACAMAALLFLSALAVPARAQNTYEGSTVIHAGSIGLVPGQSVSITVPNFYFQDGSVKFFVKHSIKVYETRVSERTSGLVYSGESGGLNEAAHEVGHLFTLGYGDLPVPGEPRTGRVQVWIEIESFPSPSTQERAEVGSVNVLPPTFELIDDVNGRTVLIGLLLPAVQKVRDKNGL